MKPAPFRLSLSLAAVAVLPRRSRAKKEGTLSRIGIAVSVATVLLMDRMRWLRRLRPLAKSARAWVSVGPRAMR